MVIRQEREGDYSKIRKMVRQAFENAEHSDKTEHLLVDKLRKSDSFIKELAFVAEEQGEIVGHIMFTEIKVGSKTGLALAPLSVHPSSQRKGVGTALMNTAHEAAMNMGYDFSVVLGSEKYYPRVGYRRASEYGISAPFEVPDENYMVLMFNDVVKLNGTVEYAKEMLG